MNPSRRLCFFWASFVPAFALVSCGDSVVADAADKPSVAAAVQRSDLPVEIELSGSFIADNKDEIRMEPKAYRGDLIITELVPEGSAVEKGDTLMRFDPSSLEDSLDEAKDEVKAKEIAVEKAQAELKAWEIERGNSNAKLEFELDKATRSRDEAKAVAEDVLADKEKTVADANRSLADAKVDLEQLLGLYEERELHTATENILIERERRKVQDGERRAGKAAREFERWKLFTEGVELREKELEVAQKRGEIEKATVRSVAERKEKEAEVRKAERELEKAKEKVAELKADAAALSVEAPRDGVVFYGSLATDDGSDFVVLGLGGGNDDLKVGGRVRTVQTLMTVASMEELSVKMRAREGDIQHLRAGLPIVVRPDAFPALAIEGELKNVDQVASRSGFMSKVREFSVQASYDGSYPQLRSGMNCRVTVRANSIPDCLQVPVLAVFSESDQHYCWVDDGGRRTKRPVKIGASNGNKVEILEGLREGESVLLHSDEAL